MKSNNNREKVKKRRKIPLKVIIFTSFLLFSVVLLVLLWICQTVLLDTFYKKVKTYDANAVVDYLSKQINEENFDVLVALQSNARDVSVTVLDSEFEVIYSADARDSSSFFKNIPTEQLYNFYNKAISNSSNRYSEYFSGFGRRQDETSSDASSTVPEKPAGESRSGKAATSLMVVQVLRDNDGNTFTIIVNSMITPVDSVIQTLRYILIAVSVIMVAAALIIALLISNHITKPIKNITKKAEILSRGKYDEVKFSPSSIKEIDELSLSLNNTKTELGKIDSLQKELIANISHDLRTPLTLISGYAEVMRDIPGEATDENLQVIIDESNRMSSLVSDVLDISKFNSGVQQLNPEEFDFTECVKSLIPRYNKLVQKDDYKIILDDRQGGSATVNADRTRILQVIYNLINNAVSYTGKDKTVRIRVIKNNSSVEFHVSDSGEGIPQDKLPYIWDRYYKVEKNHRRAQMGSGLGLSIVKNILDLHHAEYGVTSVVGKGSDFWFSLKLVDPSAE